MRLPPTGRHGLVGVETLQRHVPSGTSSRPEAMIALGGRSRGAGCGRGECLNVCVKRLVT